MKRETERKGLSCRRCGAAAKCGKCREIELLPSISHSTLHPISLHLLGAGHRLRTPILVEIIALLGTTSCFPGN